MIPVSNKDMHQLAMLVSVRRDRYLVKAHHWVLYVGPNNAAQYSQALTCKNEKSLPQTERLCNLDPERTTWHISIGPDSRADGEE